MDSQHKETNPPAASSTKAASGPKVGSLKDRIAKFNTPNSAPILPQQSFGFGARPRIPSQGNQQGLIGNRIPSYNAKNSINPEIPGLKRSNVESRELYGNRIPSLSKPGAGPIVSEPLRTVSHSEGSTSQNLYATSKPSLPEISTLRTDATQSDKVPESPISTMVEPSETTASNLDVESTYALSRIPSNVSNATSVAIVGRSQPSDGGDSALQAEPFIDEPHKTDFDTSTESQALPANLAVAIGQDDQSSNAKAPEDPELTKINTTSDAGQDNPLLTANAEHQQLTEQNLSDLNRDASLQTADTITGLEDINRLEAIQQPSSPNVRADAPHPTLATSGDASQDQMYDAPQIVSETVETFTLDQSDRAAENHDTSTVYPPSGETEMLEESEKKLNETAAGEIVGADDMGESSVSLIDAESGDDVKANATTILQQSTESNEEPDTIEGDTLAETGINGGEKVDSEIHTRQIQSLPDAPVTEPIADSVIVNEKTLDISGTRSQTPILTLPDVPTNDVDAISPNSKVRVEVALSPARSRRLSSEQSNSTLAKAISEHQESVSTPAEYHKDFTSKKSHIEAIINASTASGDSSKLGQAAQQLSSLKTSLTSASDYLPAYDARRYNEAIQGLDSQLRSLQPARTRFAFKKSSGSMSLAKQATIDLPGSATPPLEESDTGASGLACVPALEKVAEYTLKEQSDRYITLKDFNFESDSQPSDGKPLRISSIDRCITDLCDVPKLTGLFTSAEGVEASRMDTPVHALYVNDLRQSVIIAPPIAGSVHVTGAKDSLIVVNCHQLRMHDSERCTVLLHSGTNPIIEHCTDISFGEYPEELMGDDDFEVPQVIQVQDFDWLRPEPSPNWRLIQNQRWPVPNLSHATNLDLTRKEILKTYSHKKLSTVSSSKSSKKSLNFEEDGGDEEPGWAKVHTTRTRY